MQPTPKPPLLVLVGPTAVGKTGYSLDLAEAWNAEIISGDSMQVYRGMDIGTAKLPPEQRRGIPHHLIDVRDPREPYSVADFQAECRRLIADIRSRGKLPFIVGGTGLYVESVCYDYQFADYGSDEPYRAELQRLAEAQGNEAVHALLAQVDPASAARLHANDARRVIRALEVHRTTGKPLSEHLHGQKKTSPYELCMVGLTMDRALLYARVEERVDAMLAQGLEQEVRELLHQGVPRQATAMQSLGYKELLPYLAGECSHAEAVRILKRDTRHFAKRQLSWFRHMTDIRWVDVGFSQNFHENLHTIHAIIAGKFRKGLEYRCN
ncbi:tRNA (adenosine(37)-N6)-dimethylallyltransferase MiaA [Paenibacillus sp. IB182496]|uniref:tRNA dimethylallyltransferase n=1 Tax=Paenibacillus sabuli TaxID=2772509 RepID=A0A927BY89_9BACL|nr:tRNA (adenosine(37)-N6)-dimethylallyltransferase MiaA [Paenibacillus sabuli]MBD2847614.1 tRNA (adenosine(37)-N6)-dimethylallyltransferase MiaA [Paenibacillus sabuli]